MAEELDEFGIPIRKKSASTVEVDEFGIPIKKKASSVISQSGGRTSGGIQTNGFNPTNPFNSQSVEEYIGPEKANQARKEVANKKPLNINMAAISRLKPTEQTNRDNINSPTKFAAKERLRAQEQEANYDMLNAEMTAGQSIANSASNFKTNLEKVIPQLNLAATDIWEGLLGKELASKWYALEGRDIKQDRLDAYDELERLDSEMKATKGNIADNLKYLNGSGLVANLADAVFNLGSTALPAAISMGSLTATSTVGQSIADYNNAKAKSQGKTIEELYENGDSDLGVPLTLGAVATGLEFIGLKGAQKAITSKLTGSALKKAAIFAMETNKEGVTEWLQTGIDKANKAIAEGDDVEKVTDKVVDGMFSKEGLNSYLMGTFGVLGAAGVARTAEFVVNNRAKAEVIAKTEELSVIENDLKNEAVPSVAKDVLIKEAEKKVSEITNIVDKDIESFEKLAPEQKQEVEALNLKSAELQQAASDPNLSEQAKVLVENEIKAVDKQLSEIKPVEATKVSEEVITPTEEVHATETIKPIANEPVQIDNKIEDVQEANVEEAEQITAKIIAKAEDDLKALKQVTNKSAKYDGSIKRLTEAKKAGTITEQQFNEYKDRFDDVIADSAQQVKEEVEIKVEEPKETTAPEKEFAIKEVERGAINWDGDMFTPRPELGLEWKDIRKGRQDLLDGKDTTASRRLVQALNRARADGGYNFVQGAGSASAKLFVPIEGNLPTNSFTEEEVSKIDREEDLLSSEYDEYFNSLSEEDKQQEFNSIENGNKNKLDQETESGKDVSDKEATEPTKAGDPIRKFASRLREGKVNKLGGFRTSTGFDAAWDLGIEATALALETTADLADAIQQGLKAIRQTEWYKSLSDKEKFDEAFKNHIESEFTAEENAQTEQDIKTIGLTKDDVAVLREELGDRQFINEVRGNAERIGEATRLIDEGYNIKRLINKLNSDTDFFPTAVEVEIVKQYYASLTDRLSKKPTPELLKERTELLKTIDNLKVEQGRAVQAWDGVTELQDNLANFLTEESQYVDLSPEQISELSEKYNRAKETIARLQEKMTEELAKGYSKKALSEIEKAKRTGNKGLVKEAYVRERKQYVADFRAELKKIRQTPSAIVLPYSRELIALAPFARKMMQSYVSEGIYELNTIVKGIHKEFKEDISELTEDDIRDIIAGKYRNPKQTKNAILAQIRDLERQARLETKIEDLKRGINKLSSPRQKIENARIKDLEDEIKVIKKRNPELTYPNRLEGRKTWFNNRIKELKNDIKKGNFEPLEPDIPILLDDEALRLKDEYVKFKEETRERRQNYERKALSGVDKALSILQEVAATKRLVQTSIDLSIPLRQGISVMLNPRTFHIGAEAYLEMLKGVRSERLYDRMMFDIEQNPMYLRSKDDGIVYQEVGALNNEKRDEFHQDHFLYKAPVLGRLLKGSERAAAAWTNYARFELYLRGTKQLEAQGKTRANSKQAYEDMSARVMVNTGRGKIPGISDKTASKEGTFIKKLLGNTLYGARLASATFRKLNPLYYFNPKVDRTVRIEALKDMAGYTAGLIALGYLATAFGYSISFDWDDSDFLKLRKGDEVIDISGGQSTYIRTFMRLVAAAFMQADPDVNERDANKYSQYALRSLQTFWRNKLAPNTSYAVNAFMGENTLGQKFDPYEILYIYPMYTDDIIKAFKDGSPTDLATIIPLSISGLGYQVYPDRGKKSSVPTPLTIR